MNSHRRDTVIWRRRSAGRMALAGLLAATIIGTPAFAQESKRRWDELCHVRQEKFDKVLPAVMRANHIAMWIVPIREGEYDPNYELLGRGYPHDDGGVYVFTDRGNGRIERAALGISGPFLQACASYDIFGPRNSLKAFVEARQPKSIGINVATEIGTADGLSHSLYLSLTRELGPDLARRMIPAEKMVSEFRSTHVQAELTHFSQAGEISRNIAERALSNEVITPDRTTLADVAWWMMDRLAERGITTAFDLPRVYVLGPVRAEASSDHIIRRGELLAIDWGVLYQNQYTDMKRLAYVLKDGENAPPAGVQRAFDKAMSVRNVIMSTIKPGITAGSALNAINATVARMPGYALSKFGDAGDDQSLTDIFVGSHSTGDRGHGSGPSVASFNPLQTSFLLVPGNFLSIELYSYSSVPEWGKAKITFPLEDDAIVTNDGVAFAYPANSHILLIK